MAFDIPGIIMPVMGFDSLEAHAKQRASQPSSPEALTTSNRVYVPLLDFDRLTFTLEGGVTLPGARKGWLEPMEDQRWNNYNPQGSFRALLLNNGRCASHCDDHSGCFALWSRDNAETFPRLVTADDESSYLSVARSASGLLYFWETGYSRHSNTVHRITWNQFLVKVAVWDRKPELGRKISIQFEKRSRGHYFGSDHMDDCDLGPHEPWRAKDDPPLSEPWQTLVKRAIEVYPQIGHRPSEAILTEVRTSKQEEDRRMAARDASRQSRSKSYGYW